MLPPKEQESLLGMLRLFSRLLNVVTVIALLSGVSLFGQNAAGSFSGQITDQDGGILRNAAVTIINQDSLVKRQTRTDGEGMYTVQALPPGRYQVIVEAEGFSRRASQIVTLAAGQAFAFSVKMSVGKVQTDVLVTGEGGATAVETDTASISTTLGEHEVAGYGLNGRNFSQLITMAPGVSNQTGQDEAKVGVAGSAKFSVNGGRVEYNTFEIDGSDVLNTSINASRGQGEPLMVYPSIDAIQNMQVLTADYGALHGKSASGSVMVTTKSGTDQFHGNIYGFLRNEMFNARNYFDQPDPEPVGYTGKLNYRTPLYRRLDFGGTIGGPLFIPHVYNNNKNRTFFFFSEEVRREKTPVDYNQGVPTMAERGEGQNNPGVGDFSDVCPILLPGMNDTYNPAYADCPQGPAFPDSSQASSGRVVAVGYASRAILDTGIIPEPNSSSGCNSTNTTPLPHCYVTAVSPPTHWREELFRIDHNLVDTERLSFRYIHDAWDTVTLAPQWGIVQNSFPTVENRLTGPGLNMVLSLAQTLPHGFTNLISANYEVEHITLASQPGPGVTSLDRPTILTDPNSAGATPISPGSACGQLSPSGTGKTPSSVTACPMGYIFSNGFGGNKMPGLDFQGNNGAYGGHGFAADTGYAPWNQANPTFNLRDDASKTIGKHTIQWGFEGTFVQQNELSAVSGANSGDLQGLLTYSDQQSTYTTGNAFADFLAGSGFINNPAPTFGYVATGGIKSFTQDSGQVKYYNRYKIAELYLQDDWRVNSRLTINAGFRASLFGVWYNPKNTAYNWRPEDFNQSTAASIYVDQINSYLVDKASGVPVALPRNGPYSLSSLDGSITNGLVQCGVSGLPDSCMKNQVFHPAPRIGFSWDPWGNGKTAIRAGYGIYWEHGTGYEANVGSLIGSAPLVLSETQSNIRNNNQIGFSCQGGATQCGSAGPVDGATFPLNVTSIPTKAVYAYTQQWSLGVEHEIRKQMVAQFAYVGTKGTHLTAVRDLNQLQPLGDGLNPFQPGQPVTSAVCGSGAAGGPFSVAGVNGSSGGPITIPSSAGISPGTPGYINMFVACTGNPGFAVGVGADRQKIGISPDILRPYLGFSNVISVENIADSEYHAFQATLRQTTGPLTVGVAYTFSHSIDDSSDRSSANFANSLDIHSNRASSDFDQRHLLNVSYIYDLPFLRLFEGFVHLVGSGLDPGEDGPQPPVNEEGSGASPLLKSMLGGWQLSGITAYQTGTPFSVINGGGADGTGAADNAGVGDALGVGSYADVIGSAKVGKPFVASSNSNIGPLLLNPGAFAAPRGLTFGDSGRNYLNNPSRINFNMSLFKHWKPFQERLDIEFRAEAFNVFNHTQFRITDPANPGNTGNNVINCYGNQVQLYSAGASSCLAGNSFLHPVDAHDPRILQFALKGSF